MHAHRHGPMNCVRSPNEKGKGKNDGLPRNEKKIVMSLEILSRNIIDIYTKMYTITIL